MFNTLELNADLTRLHQQELRDNAERLRRQPTGSGSPVLAAIGKHLVTIGERLQHSARVQAQPAFELHTKQA